MLFFLATLLFILGISFSSHAATCSHIWATKYDSAIHWEYCTNCGEIRNKKAHSFTDNWLYPKKGHYAPQNYKTRTCGCGYSYKYREPHGRMCNEKIQNERNRVWTMFKSKKKQDMDYLLKAGMLDQRIADYLIEKVRYGKSIIFCGEGASGKTTLMNCLIDYIPHNKSGLVIQESGELFSDVHPSFMFQHVTINVDHGQKTYDLRAEAMNGLLTDLDYFIIGEVKDAEVKYFITAAEAGHRCWCSIHSLSSTDAIDKLADYITYDSPYSKTEAEYMLKDLGTVMFLKNYKVCEIFELNGWDEEHKQIIYKKIYKRPE